MDKFLIHGGVPLKGKISISGSKNAALPALAAALLTDRPVILDRVPDVWDLATMRKLLTHMGVEVERDGGRLTICAANLTAPETRASSPIRIPRDDESRQSISCAGLYPVGEGAGYAGGIVSSAADGMKTAENIIRQFAPL